MRPCSEPGAANASIENVSSSTTSASNPPSGVDGIHPSEATCSGRCAGATMHARADTRSQPRSIVNGSSVTRVSPMARN